MAKNEVKTVEQLTTDVTENINEVVVEEVKEAKSVTLAKAKGEDLVSFIPTKTGKSLIMGKEYIYTEGKEIKIPDSIAGILTSGKKGHKK